MTNPVSNFFSNLWGSPQQEQPVADNAVNPQQELTEALKTIAQNSTEVLNSDEEYVRRKEAEKLTEADVISKVGLPIYTHEETGTPFVHPDALKAFNENFVAPKTKNLEKAVSTQNDYIAVQQAEAARQNIFNEISTKFPEEIRLYGQGVPLDSVISVLANPNYSDALRDIMSRNEREGIKIALQIARQEYESSSNLLQTYNNLIPNQPSQQMDDGGIEVPSSGNRYQRTAPTEEGLSSYKNGDILALVVPDNMPFGSSEYEAALLKFNRLTSESEKLFKNDQKLVRVEMVTESERGNLRPRSTENKVHYEKL